MAVHQPGGLAQHDQIVHFVNNKVDHHSLGIESASSAHTMDVPCSLIRNVVVNDQIDLLNVNSSAE